MGKFNPIVEEDFHEAGICFEKIRKEIEKLDSYGGHRKTLLKVD